MIYIMNAYEDGSGIRGCVPAPLEPTHHCIKKYFCLDSKMKTILVSHVWNVVCLAITKFCTCSDTLLSRHVQNFVLRYYLKYEDKEGFSSATFAGKFVEIYWDRPSLQLPHHPSLISAQQGLGWGLDAWGAMQAVTDDIISRLSCQKGPICHA